MSNFNANIWPPLVFPGPAANLGRESTAQPGPAPPSQLPRAAATTGPTPTATPGPAPPSRLPRAVATTTQSTAAAQPTATLDYADSVIQAQATLNTFRIYPPTYPTVSNPPQS